MARTHLRFTYVVKDRYWRFRHRKVGDLPLPYDPTIKHWSQQCETAAFMTRYAELLDAVEREKSIKPVSKHSFAWLIDSYLKSAEFGELADSTQRDYERTCTLLKAELASVQFALATRAILRAVRDDHKDTIRKAHKIKQMLSRLYSWADEQDLVPAGFNPAKSIKRLTRKGGAREIVVWSEAEIETFLKTCPAHVKTPVLIALYTGQRREDVAKMTWQQFQGDTIRVRQSKTSALLDIACHSVLRAHLDALPKRAVVICTTAAGKAFSTNGMSKALEDAVKANDDMPNGRSFHGLRYASGSKMEEAGATIGEIEAVLGHSTMKMAMKYATQRLRAKAAMEKMEAVG